MKLKKQKFLYKIKKYDNLIITRPPSLRNRKDGLQIICKGKVQLKGIEHKWKMTFFTDRDFQ